MEHIYDYTIKLIRYVLNGDIPELPENIDFEKLFAFGKSHGVENMLYIGMRDLQIAVPEDTMKKFKKAYEMAIMLEAKQAFELESIGEAFEEAGIDYIPLKGSVVKYLYPMPDYRKSGDIDILVHAEDEKAIDKVMQQGGYTRYEEADYHDIHSVYKKPKYITVELHRRLVHKDDRSVELCNEAWKYAELSEGKQHTYNFNNEFLYCYMLAHLTKHLYRSGAGIKMLLDLWIMTKKINLNEDRLNEYLKKGKLIDINEMLNDLIGLWFEGKKTSNDITNILATLICTSGSFGTSESKQMIVDNDVKINKLKRLKKRIFPTYAYFSERYVFIKKRPYLMPVGYVIRWIKILLFKRNRIAEDLKQSVGSVKNKQPSMQRIINAIK